MGEAFFRITPGTVITARCDKPQYEVGETIRVTIEYSCDAKGLPIGSFWTTTAEVWVGGYLAWSGDDKHDSWTSVSTAASKHTAKFAILSPGQGQAHVVIRARAGIV